MGRRLRSPRLPGVDVPGVEASMSPRPQPRRARRWADVYVCMLADGVAPRNRCPRGQADPRAAIAGGASGVTMARAGPSHRHARRAAGDRGPWVSLPPRATIPGGNTVGQHADVDVGPSPRAPGLRARGHRRLDAGDIDAGETWGT